MRKNNEGIEDQPMGERLQIRRGPLRGKYVTLLGFHYYRSSGDLEAQEKITSGWVSDSGRVYEARFDDGGMTKVLDVEFV